MNGLALFYTTAKILNEQNAQIHSTFTHQNTKFRTGTAKVVWYFHTAVKMQPS